MTANIHAETGIPYGVVSGHSCGYLMDDIFSSGDDCTFAAFKKELADELRAALAGAVENHASKERAARCVEGIDCDELTEAILDGGLNDSLEFEESEYDYESDGVRYHLGYLGGAPLIWILDSPYVAAAPGCSPCVPNAGDLDNMERGGAFCYCCPPDCFGGDGDDEDSDKYAVIGETEINGKTYKIVGKRAGAGAVEDEETFSTYCGSMTREEAQEHAKQCGVCRDDFISRGIIDDSPDETEDES